MFVGEATRRDNVDVVDVADVADVARPTRSTVRAGDVSVRMANELRVTAERLRVVEVANRKLKHRVRKGERVRVEEVEAAAEVCRAGVAAAERKEGLAIRATSGEKSRGDELKVQLEHERDKVAETEARLRVLRRATEDLESALDVADSCAAHAERVRSVFEERAEANHDSVEVERGKVDALRGRVARLAGRIGGMHGGGRAAAAVDSMPSSSKAEMMSKAQAKSRIVAAAVADLGDEPDHRLIARALVKADLLHSILNDTPEGHDALFSQAIANANTLADVWDADLSLEFKVDCGLTDWQMNEMRFKLTYAAQPITTRLITSYLIFVWPGSQLSAPCSWGRGVYDLWVFLLSPPPPPLVFLTLPP